MNYTKSVLLIFSAFFINTFCHVVELQNMSEYNAVMKNSENKLIKFYAPWCGACKQMDAPYKNVADKNKNLKFYAVNLDLPVFKELHKTHNIKGYPTTILFKGDKEVKVERGSVPESEIQSAIQESFGK